jgi:ATP-binding cassette, subfamily B, bacterial
MGAQSPAAPTRRAAGLVSRARRAWVGFRLYGRALKLLWAAAPAMATVMAGLLVVQGGLPPLSIWLFKRIVDAVSRGAWAGSGGPLLALWAGAALAGQLITQWVMLAQSSLNERFTAHVEGMLIRKANSLPDLAAFEDPAFYDDMQMLTRLAPYRPLNLMSTTVQLLPNLIASAGLLILLGALAAWLPWLLIATTLPLGWANLRLQRQSWATTLAQGPQTRAMRYFTTLATTDTHAKEVRVLGMGGYLERRYWQAFQSLRREAGRRRLRQAPGPILAAVLFAASTILAFWWVVAHAVEGRATPGDIVLVLQTLAALQTYLGGMAAMVALLVGHLLFFGSLFDFLGYQSPMAPAADGAAADFPLRSGIAFANVSYRYANGAAALDDVSFAIHPGECVALVGENGAGKTTLVKLLCRLYDPSAGAIAVDGVDLRELDLERWRSGLGAVFQDFGRYHLTVAENIALGRLDALDSPGQIERAAAAAGFAGHAARLPAGYATQLGAQFGGVDLSGGQWQSLGIARALLRDAPILILDEPTAALDPRAEAALFERLRQLAAGKTTLFITHRLASVSMADRILVLKQGRLVEQGTHRALMEQNGEYAALYRLQAEHYLTAAAER